MHVQIAQNLSQFESMSSAWDDLWLNSHNDNPLAKFAPLKSALKHFWKSDQMRAFIVFDDRIPVMGMVIAQQKYKKILTGFANTNNQWGSWGQLLVNPAKESAEAYRELVRGIHHATRSLIHFREIPAESCEWSSLIGAFRQAGSHVSATPAYFVGIIEHDECWPEFQGRFKGGFRKKMAKYMRKLRQQGELSFDHHRAFDRRNLDRLVTEAFELENRGWKNVKSGSVIKSNQFEFFLEQARLLAAAGDLRVSFLRLNGKSIAFDFGAIGNQTYMSWKIGYDSGYSRFAPGQVLSHFMTECFHEHHSCLMQDTMGPATQATARWSTRFMLKSNVLISGKGTVSKTQARLLDWLRGIWKSTGPLQCPEPGLKQKPQDSALVG